MRRSLTKRPQQIARMRARHNSLRGHRELVIRSVNSVDWLVNIRTCAHCWVEGMCNIRSLLRPTRRLTKYKASWDKSMSKSCWRSISCPNHAWRSIYGADKRTGPSTPAITGKTVNAWKSDVWRRQRRKFLDRVITRSENDRSSAPRNEYSMAGDSPARTSLPIWTFRHLVVVIIIIMQDYRHPKIMAVRQRLDFRKTLSRVMVWSK